MNHILLTSFKYGKRWLVVKKWAEEFSQSESKKYFERIMNQMKILHYLFLRSLEKKQNKISAGWRMKIKSKKKRHENFMIACFYFFVLQKQRCHPVLNIKMFSEQSLLLLQMCSLTFNIVIILLNICYLLFTCASNEVYPADDDSDFDF